jgi:hypothetical protein
MRKYDEDDARELNAKQWQLDLLKLNPEYVHWGPHEDYMWVKGDGWNSGQSFESWSDFGPWQLDDLNECVNFYFSVIRESKDCPTCQGKCWHPKAWHIADTFYPHTNPQGIGWHDHITQDEVQALLDEGRLRDFTRDKDAGYVPTPEEVNEAQRVPGRVFHMQHDAFNRHILTKARLKRLGLPVHCDTCQGTGSVYVADEAHVELTLWMLHPRKGASRGVEIKNVEQADLPAVFRLLRQAAERNANRFASIPA